MKIWEKINNITGNDSKSRYLIPYINAGSKFILSSLPEKFLWTIASETEVNGWDDTDTNNDNIGAGSAIAYDKVLAVYRYDSGKKRICSEAPDNSIHIFDEASSLLRATKMFPKFYKLSGKIYIKPDPDYNDTSSATSYTELGASSTTAVSANAGDKGIIVYSAPPIVDENTDSWILAEYENIVLYYAASLDYFRLSSVYRDLCKAQIDAVASGTLTFSVSSILPSTFSISSTLPSFSFTNPLPVDINITSALPSGLNLSTSLPSIEVIATNLPSDFSSPDSIASPGELSHLLNTVSITDALTKAEQLIDGSVTTNNAQEWLNDEDSEMTASTIGVANSEVGRAQATIQKEKAKLEEFSSKVSQKLNKYQNDVGNYSSQVQKEATRITSQLSKVQREVEKKVQVFQAELQKYQAELAEESARTKIDITNYATELTKEKTRVESGISKWQADLSKTVQEFNSNLQKYQAEIQKESQRVNSDNAKYQSDLANESKVLEKQIQQFSLDIQAAQVYTQKSQQAIQSSGLFYQRAVQELGAITGSVAAPEQQQSTQRREQGATS